MSNCITRAINSRAEPLTITRPSPGVYDNHGRWQGVAPEILSIKGEVQPMRPEEISRLEDSRHIIEAIKIYTTDDVRNMSVTKQTQPDKITRGSIEYEVYSYGNWDLYSKILAVRKEEQ